MDNEYVQKYEENTNTKEDMIERFDEEFTNRPFDLSNDLLVNEIAALENRPINSDSEWIRALEDDLRVNDIAKKNNWPMNPDSEFLDFENEMEGLKESFQDGHADLLDLPDKEVSIGDDLKVNKLTATGSFNLHPDVEIIDFGNDIEGSEARYRYESDR